MQRDSHRVPASRRSARAGFVLKPALLVLLLTLTSAIAPGCSPTPMGGTQEPTGTASQALGPFYISTGLTPITSSATVYAVNLNYPFSPTPCVSTSEYWAAKCWATRNAAQFMTALDPEALYATFSDSGGQTCDTFFSLPQPNLGATSYTTIFYNSGTRTGDGCVDPLKTTAGAIALSDCATGYYNQANQCVPAPGFAENFGVQAPDLSGASPSNEMCHGMCAPTASKTSATLAMHDAPVGYAPQKGPDVFVTVAYNHADTVQPASPNYANLGPRFTHRFLSYITDNPSSPGGQVTRYVMGGGQVDYTFDTTGSNSSAGPFNSTTGAWSPEIQGAAVLTRIPASGTVTSYTLTMPDGSVQTYAQPDGASSYPRRVFLTGVTDPAGNSLALAYDGSNRLTTITDAESRVTTFNYSGSSLLIQSVTDPFGRSATFSYDSYGRLSSIQDVLGITSSFTWDGNPVSADAGTDAGADAGAGGDPYFISQLTTPYGTSNFTGGSDGENATWLELTDPDGNTERVEYNQTNSAIAATESSTPSGMSVENGAYNMNNTFYWDKYVYPTYGTGSGKDYTKAEITHWNTTNTGQAASIPQSVKKPLENRVYYTYPGQASASSLIGTLDKPSAIGRVLDDASSQVSTFTYNTLGFVTQAVDPLGRTTTYTYDTNKIDLLTVKQLTATGPTFTTTDTYTYNSAHEPLTHVDAASQTWRYCYNSAGQLTQAIDPANYGSGSSCGSYGTAGTLFSYDGTGRLTTVTNAAGNTQLTNTYPSTCSTTGGINCDLPSSVTDSEGRTVSYARDALDRVTTTTYPDSTTDVDDYTFQSGTYSGTQSLEVRKHTDRLSRATTYGFDAERRLTSVTDPLTHTVSYGYYADGTLHTQTDQSSHATTWSIDVESRPTTKTYADSSTQVTAYESTTSRVHSVTDALSQVKTYGYDESNELSAVTYTGAVHTTPNVTFTWDTYFPRRTQMVDGIGSTAWTYVAIGSNGALKLATDDGPYSGTVDKQTIAYDVDGRPNSLTIDSLAAETWSYDALGRATSHVTQLGTWTNAFNGQTADITSRTLGSTGISTAWGYDSNTNDRRLVSITNASTGSSPGPRSFAFGYGTAADGGGAQNPYTIMSSSQTSGGGGSWASQTWAYSYDSTDKLTSAVGSTAGTYSFAFDSAGNTTTYTTGAAGAPTTTNPTFNSVNEMTANGSLTPAYTSDGESSSQGRSHQAYTFDAENRLVSLTIPPHFPISWTVSFQYDGLGRRLASGFSVGGSPTMTHWLWMGDRMIEQRDSSDNPVRLYYPEGEYTVSGTKKLVYFPDQVGSARDTVEVGSLAMQYEADYAPYGYQEKGWQKSGSVTLHDFRFAGMLNEAASNEYLTPARLYSYNEGRFMDRDPLAESQGPNLFAYANGNPISAADPSGLQVEGEEDSRAEVEDEIQNDINRAEFNAARETLRQVEPNNPQITYEASPGWTPSEQDVETLQNEVESARDRQSTQRACSLYQKIGPNGEHLKFGVTYNPETRYTPAQLGGGTLKIIGQGSRSDMLRLERNLHETLPIGSEEGQTFYIQKQIGNGLTPPPYAKPGE